MQEQGIMPSNVTYSILIKIYGKSKNLPKALSLIKEMKDWKIKPGLIVYTCLIQTCIKSNEIEEALKKFKEMTAEGIYGDSVTYSTLLKGCLQFKKFKDACDLYEEAQKHWIQITYDLKNSLIQQIQRSKDVTLLSRVSNLEKVGKPKYFEPNLPPKTI